MRSESFKYQDARIIPNEVLLMSGRETGGDGSFDNPKSHRGVLVFIVGRDGVLFLKRADNDDIQPGKWGAVTGHADGDETPMQAAIREVKEEAGIDVQAKDLKYMGITKAKFEYGRDGSGIWTNFTDSVYYFVDYGLTKDKIKISEEHSAAVFLPVERFLKLKDDIRAMDSGLAPRAEQDGSFHVTRLMSWPDADVMRAGVADALLERLRGDGRARKDRSAA